MLNSKVISTSLAIQKNPKSPHNKKLTKCKVHKMSK